MADKTVRPELCVAEQAVDVVRPLWGRFDGRLARFIWWYFAVLVFGWLLTAVCEGIQVEGNETAEPVFVVLLEGRR